ncbi:MAG: acyl carrier protein [Gammaproteobacteria bacterium]
MSHYLRDLLATIAGILGPGAGTLDLDSGLDVTPEWDSLKNMEVLLKVEETFGVRFSADELMSLHTIRGINLCLRSRGLIG